MQQVTKTFSALLLIGILASCGKLPTTTSVNTVPMEINTLTPLGSESVTISATISPTSTSTPTPLPTQTLIPVDYSFSQIRVEKEGDREIWTAFWRENGDSINYAFIDYYHPLLFWFMLDFSDLSNIIEKPILAPRIAYPPKPSTFGILNEYQGLISPSGRYRMRIASDNTLQIYDTVRQSNYKTTARGDHFKGAYWDKKEDRIFFAVGSDYGTRLYLFDITQQKLIETNELLGIQGSELYDPEIYDWAPSPDGKYLARFDRQGLHVVSLEDKSTSTFNDDRPFGNLRWSGDSKRLYYFSGNPGDDRLDTDKLQVLGYYEPSTRTFGDVIELSRLNKFIKSSNFDVSADGKQFVFWFYGDIWLLNLR
jgi:hypothetical protein